MKKLILCLIAVLGFAFGANAQVVAKKTVKANTTVKKTETPAVEKKKTTHTNQKQATKKEVVLKKDGTPDKRYNSSKTLKKDGTPDMRYKVNKKTEVKK
jgi:L-cysteine desulfidase